MDVFFWFILITAVVFEITCMSVVFTKADKPIWGCFVPIYGVILLCDVARESRWWTLLFLIPFVNIVAYIMLSFGVTRNFERSDGSRVRLVFPPIVSYAILAFGDSEYEPYYPPEGTMLAGRASSASPVTHPQQGETLTSYAPKQQPQWAKCPFCRSISFRVEEEAGYRRCSNCHSVLPSHIQARTR
jgi:hypothetical protein